MKPTATAPGVLRKKQLAAHTSRRGKSSPNSGSSGKRQVIAGRKRDLGKRAAKLPSSSRQKSGGPKAVAAPSNLLLAVKIRLANELDGPVRQDGFSETPPAGQARLVWGRSGDHASIYHMLLAVFQGPSRDEFHAQTEDPFYEPTDRLLVKRGFRVLSHLHLTRRTIQFGSLRLPVAGFHWLGTLPEFRAQGFATRLLTEAHRRIAADGAVLGLVKTRIPHFFHRAGWALCGRHCFSQAKARDVLASLHTDHAQRLTKPLSIRLWRHVEMPALMRIYQQNVQREAYGPLERTEAYWRWLIGRQAYDGLLVALDGPDKLELEESIAPIVGYAVLKQDRVVELLTTPGHPTANYQLLARAAIDVIDHDRQDLFVNAPPNHPLHRLVGEAGGAYCHQEIDQQEVFMVKVVDPQKLLSLLAPELESRAKQAGLPRDTELGLSVDGAKYRLVSTRRGFRVRGGKLGRSYLTLNGTEFTRLVLGHNWVRETAFAGRIQPSTQTALDLAEALFPRLPLWRPVWDDLPA